MHLEFIGKNDGYDGGGCVSSILGAGEATLSVAEPTGEGLEEVQDIVGCDPRFTEPRGAHRYDIFL